VAVYRQFGLERERIIIVRKVANRAVHEGDAGSSQSTSWSVAIAFIDSEPHPMKLKVARFEPRDFRIGNLDEQDRIRSTIPDIGPCAPARPWERRMSTADGNVAGSRQAAPLPIGGQEQRGNVLDKLPIVQPIPWLIEAVMLVEFRLF
jgi:hypothetical protein